MGSKPEVDRRSCKTCGLVGGCGCVRERPKSVSTRLRWEAGCGCRFDDYHEHLEHQHKRGGV